MPGYKGAAARELVDEQPRRVGRLSDVIGKKILREDEEYEQRRKQSLREHRTKAGFIGTRG